METFTQYLKTRLQETKDAECPSHLECGGQDAWLDTITQDIVELNMVLAILEEDDEFFGSDRELLDNASVIYKEQLSMYLGDIHNEYINEPWRMEQTLNCRYQKECK